MVEDQVVVLVVLHQEVVLLTSALEVLVIVIVSLSQVAVVEQGLAVTMVRVLSNV